MSEIEPVTRPRPTRSRLLALLCWLPATALIAGCQGALDPAGPRADDVAAAWWLMLAMGTAVYVLVLVLLGGALFRRRRAAGKLRAERLVVLGGVVLPAVVIVVLVAATVIVGGEAVRARDGELAVDVDGRQYWWSVAYPGSGAVTANEVHVPVGRPVVLRMTSADVIHSFWVPELAGKVDLIPGRTTELRLEASRAGTFRGRCAEFCGLAHTEMRLRVIAQPPAEFEAWLDRQGDPARAPLSALAAEGRQVFLGSACVYCHAIRGTNASSDRGPDLTHFASRQTLAAGALENNAGNLAGWIIDPQQLKPGTRMPGTALDPRELEAILAYFETLR